VWYTIIMSIKHHKEIVQKILNQHDRGIITDAECVDKVWEFTTVAIKEGVSA
jgi:hypothetical protein